MAAELLSLVDMLRSLSSLCAATLLVAACTDAPEDDTEVTDEDDGGRADAKDSPDNPLYPSGNKTRYPIILLHGFAASPQTPNGFKMDVAKALCDDGHAVFLPTLPPFAHSDVRSMHLAKIVDQVLEGATDICGRKPDKLPEKVNIIAHSMGGIDARFLVQRGYDHRVAAIVTISSPHRGSAMADLMLRAGAWKDRALGDVGAAAIAKLGELIGRALPTDPSGVGPDIEGAFQTMLTTQEFDLSVPAGVYAESWAGLSNIGGILTLSDDDACEDKMSMFSSRWRRHIMSLLLAPIAVVVADELHAVPNDGMVQVERAKWGTFRGCIPADHADQVGAFGVIQFDHVRFARNRAFELAAFGY